MNLNLMSQLRMLYILFVWFDSLRPINNLSVIKGRVFLGWTSTKLGFVLLKDTTQWRREAQTRGLSVLSQALYHWATALQSIEYYISLNFIISDIDLFQLKRVLLGNQILALNAPITTKVVCFSRLLKCLRSLYGKQCGPRPDCSYRSSLFWVHAVCFYT